MNLKRVQKAVDYLLTEWAEHDFTSDYVQIDEDEQTINLQYPEDDHDYPFSWDDFVGLIDDAKSIEVDIESGYIRTRSRAFQLVSPVNFEASMFDYHEYEVEVQAADGVSIGYVHNNFLVAFAAIKNGAFHEYYRPTNYTAIEIRYINPDDRFPREIESKLVDSFLFELAATHNLHFSKSQFETEFDSVDDPFEGEFDEETGLKLRPLETFNDGMRLYLAALQVADPELRFLSLFKVLEYFAPVVFSLEENDAIRRKLDSPLALAPDGNYIQSVIELVRSLERRKNDKEMIKTLFVTCIDVLELSKYLPPPRRQPLNYESKRAEIDNFNRNLAEVVVATRNQVAHAKSNYQPQGNELRSEEIPEFNEFLRLAAAQTIRWYNRLPEHQKILG
ncbi:MAG TPA: hypothetical protein VFQ47_05515 [Nitrososphaera sp.]|jgi:hypothetical protein|nr:hypothetical protein [Nitrososphaera sp.]